MRRDSRSEVTKAFIILLACLTSILARAQGEPVPTPIFLKPGFSSVIEFDEAPTQIVVGNSAAFQIEKLDRSIVIRPIATEVVTNVFVYFKKSRTRLLVLSSSEEATPTYYRKIEDLPLPTKARGTSVFSSNKKVSAEGMRVGRIKFRVPRDYLTVDVSVTANSSREISPRWDLARLNFRDRTVQPAKVWSARREIMRDSSVTARFVFAKPNVPADLKGVALVLPLADGRSISQNLGGKH